jgi:GNAT superfamily N-acetyltransferase
MHRMRAQETSDGRSAPAIGRKTMGVQGSDPIARVETVVKPVMGAERRVSTLLTSDVRPTPARATVPSVPADVVRTHLELNDPAQLSPAGPPRLDGVEITRVQPPDGELSRWFYAEVGTPYSWVDHAHRSAEEWQAWAQRVETWVAAIRGRRAGYYELLPGDAAVEIAYLGLLHDFHGAGLGGALLTHALRRALELGSRVRVHTCTLDGPHALANYLARGMRPVRTEVLARR